MMDSFQNNPGRTIQKLKKRKRDKRKSERAVGSWLVATFCHGDIKRGKGNQVRTLPSQATATCNRTPNSGKNISAVLVSYKFGWDSPLLHGHGSQVTVVIRSLEVSYYYICSYWRRLRLAGRPYE